MSNAILPEGGSAHVEELNDPYLAWFWSSNVRSTAIVLNSLVRAGAADAPLRGLVRWMMAARKKGRWGNTQENAYAMEALVAYYRKYESTVPDFRAVVKTGDEELAREEFRGRSTESKAADVPMAKVLERGAGSTRPLTFTREGAGTLFYTARLRYASDELHQKGLDAGFHVERAYSPFVEKGTRPAATTFNAGDLVRVTLTFRLTKERRFVAVTDPLPAGFGRSSRGSRRRGATWPRSRTSSAARTTPSATRPTSGRRGGSTAASTTSSATTTASCCSRRC
jgi:uncharacterized protein YfaS (alpha-2-macroglobulin family)